MPGREPPACKQCRGETSLAYSIARLGATPGVDIFRCQDCGKLHWISAPIPDPKDQEPN